MSVSRVTVFYMLNRTWGETRIAIMFTVFRKSKNGHVWHFHTQCSRWPQDNYVQSRSVTLAQGERLCDECAALEAQMFPAKK